MQDKPLMVAAGLSLVLTAVHVFGGGADVHSPILDSDLDPVLKGYVSVVWHGVTANLVICTALLFLAARTVAGRGAFVAIVAAHYTAYVGLFVTYGALRFGSVLVMPPWGLFAVILVVLAWAARPGPVRPVRA